MSETFVILRTERDIVTNVHRSSYKVPVIEEQLKNKRPTSYNLLFYFTSYVLNMFRTLIYQSSGACDCAVELPHRSFVLGLLCVGDLVRLVLSGVRVAGTPNLQHTTNREQNNRCGNSTTQSQAPDDGYINVRNMLST